MIVGGLDRDTLTAVALALDCEPENLRSVGRRLGFRLATHRPDFQRRAAPRRDWRTPSAWHAGRRIASPCYHVYRDFVRLLFAAGADYMQTTAPGGSWQSGNSGKVTYRTLAEFERDLPQFADAYVGSRAAEYDGVPAAMGQLCDHGDCFGNTSVLWVAEQNAADD